METQTRPKRPVGRPETPLENPPNRVQELRRARGMSQAELARLTGILPQHIRALEERNWMGRLRRYRVARVLGVHPEELENNFNEPSETP